MSEPREEITPPLQTPENDEMRSLWPRRDSHLGAPSHTYSDSPDTPREAAAPQSFTRIPGDTGEPAVAPPSGSHESPYEYHPENTGQAPNGADGPAIPPRPSGNANTQAAAENSDGTLLNANAALLDADSRNHGHLLIKQDVNNNYGTVVGLLQQTIRRFVDSHELPARYVAHCVNIFAEPLNIANAREKLQIHRVVVLTGPSGAGRHTSAVWLLNEIGGLTIREVRREPADGFVIDDLVSESRTGWLLDLRGSDDLVASNFGRTLVTSRELLEGAASYLAVAIRPDLWDQVKSGGDEVAVPLESPSSIDIVQQRLRREQPFLPVLDVETWLRDSRIARHLERLPPPEAVRWAEAIRAEYFTPLSPDGLRTGPDQLTDEDVLEQKVDNVIKARSNWREELLEWHRHNDSRRRNFLLAAAVLENAPTEEVFTAAEDLARAFGERDPEAPGLTGPGILELASDAGAYLPDGETLRFNRAGYADAILEYFWVDRMHLREPFINWMSDLSLRSGGSIAEAIVGRVGQYVLRWSVRRNKLDSLENVIRAWASRDELAPAAEALVTAAGLDPVLGRAMRDRMLLWAKSDQDSDIPIKAVAARACGGPLGSMYPKMMLFRIGYLAGTAASTVAAAVREAVRSLWELPDTRSRIRTDIISWCVSESSTRREAGRRTFTALAELPSDVADIPLLLVSAKGSHAVSVSDDEHSFLTRGWRSILDEPQLVEEVISAFRLWMNTALTSANTQSVILEIFSAAAHEPTDEHFNGRRYVTLSKLLFIWAPSRSYPDSRADLRDTLLYRISKHDPVGSPIADPYRATNTPDA